MSVAPWFLQDCDEAPATAGCIQPCKIVSEGQVEAAHKRGMKGDEYGLVSSRY